MIIDFGMDWKSVHGSIRISRLKLNDEILFLNDDQINLLQLNFPYSIRFAYIALNLLSQHNSLIKS